MTLKVRRSKAYIVIALLCFAPARAMGIELYLFSGGYMISAESPGRSGSIVNLGAYGVTAEAQVLPGIEVNLGYTVLVSGIIAGDLAYGLDIGINWYPFTHTRTEVWQDASHTMEVREQWRPYIGGSFNQRQFQVVQTGYAGGGFVIGVERPLAGKYSLKGFARYLLFGGPGGATATELTLGFGFGMAF